MEFQKKVQKESMQNTKNTKDFVPYRKNVSNNLIGYKNVRTETLPPPKCLQNERVNQGYVMLCYGLYADRSTPPCSYNGHNATIVSEHSRRRALSHHSVSALVDLPGSTIFVDS